MPIVTAAFMTSELQATLKTMLERSYEPMTDRDKIKAHLEQGLGFALEAARDLRTLINRLDSHDEPSMLDLADVSATLQAGALTVLKATPEVAD